MNQAPSPSDRLIDGLDHIIGFAGGVAVTLLVGAYEVEGSDVPAFLFSVLKGSLCFVLSFGILVSVLRSLHGIGRKLIAYAGVLFILALGVASMYSADEPPKAKKSLVYHPDSLLTRSP